MARRVWSTPSRVAGVLVRFDVEPARRVQVCEERCARVCVGALRAVTQVDEAERDDEGYEEDGRENYLMGSVKCSQGSDSW